MAVTSRLVNTSSTLKTQTLNIIGNGIRIESFEEETRSTREISIGNALITGGHCIKGGRNGKVHSLRKALQKGEKEDKPSKAANLGCDQSGNAKTRKQ